MKIKFAYRIAMITVIVLITGCSEKWLDEKPPQLISTASLYTTLSGFEAGLNGMYALVRQEREGSDANDATFAQGTPNQLRYELKATGTDNMCANRLGRFADVSTYWKDINSPQNIHITNQFIWLYRVVNTVNTIITNAESNDNVEWSGGNTSPVENKARVIGEAKAVRAWAYRHLTYMWGDVPLSLQEALGSTIRTDWTRTPKAEIIKQIINDLSFAVKSLPVEPSVRGKITRGAAQHYLAEMYLTVNKPDSALYWADQVINTPQYKLITERFGPNKTNPGNIFSDMFLDVNANRDQGNTEALWVWQWGYGTIGGGSNIMRRWHGSEYGELKVGGIKPLVYTVERGGRSQARYSFTKFAMDLYEPQDERGSYHIIRKFFILNNAAANSPWGADRLPAGYAYGDTIWMHWDHEIVWKTGFVPTYDWPWSRKFDHTDPLNPTASYSNKDQPYLRLAETYLIKAEAEFRLNQPDQAANTINVLRQRANASQITAGEVNIDFILDERSRELINEEHRRYTLLRTHKWLERTRLHNFNGGQNIAERDTLFPIPQIVIDANLTSPMEQNPGW
ncbi:MAG: RagB/SusD family nutrient uptake outer membrane protein [Bacteroidales bacterium]